MGIPFCLVEEAIVWGGRVGLPVDSAEIVSTFAAAGSSSLRVFRICWLFQQAQACRPALPLLTRQHLHICFTIYLVQQFPYRAVFRITLLRRHNARGTFQNRPSPVQYECVRVLEMIE